MRFGWLLHPDAETELRRVGEARGSAYEPRHKSERLGAHLKSTFSSLTLDEPCFLPSELVSAAPDHDVRWLPWCPTPYLARLVHKHWSFASHFPPPGLLRRLNDKAYLQKFPSLIVPQRRILLQQGELAPSLSEVSTASLSVGAGGPPSLRLKRRWAQAGRGQRRINSCLSPDDERYIDDGLRQGGLILEPELNVMLNCSLHGVIGDEGILIGTLVPFSTNRFQAPCPSALSLPLPSAPQLVEFTRARTEHVAEELKREGYRGPFGLDWAWTTSKQLYLLDLNARFTLNWTQGMADQRQLALDLLPNYFSTR